MIASERELGLGDEHDGVILLTQRLPAAEVAALAPGDDLVPVLGLDREVVEVNVTPDRGYCLSIRGVAREYSHSTGAAFTDPADVPVAAPTTGGYAVRLADDAPLEGVAGCDRYVARVVRGLDLARHTPSWMKTRLTEAGMRPISLAVDVTNYVMLAVGQPLHAFDLSRLDGPIVVRRARAGERLTTLDDVDRTLDPQDLLITCGERGEGERVLALAGVMGGEDGEVRPGQTSDVLVESAHFDPRTVARTARRHKLATEASKRFERGVDPDIAGRAAQLAVTLLVELGGGVADREVTDADQRADRSNGPVITLDLDLPSRYVGVDYPPARVREVLEMIGCEVADAASGTVSVRPPSWRPDLTDPTTLVEEVARIDGYDKIPSVLPPAPGGRGLTHEQRSRRTVADALAGAGLIEVLSLPFLGVERFGELDLPADDPLRGAVTVANPLSEQAPLLRTEVLQTLPDTLRRNLARGAHDVALFEISRVTRPVAGAAAAPVPGVGARPQDEVLDAIRAAVPPQPWHLAMMGAGEAEHSGWWGSGRAVDATDAVAWAHLACDALGVRVERVPADRAPWHPGRCVELRLPTGATVGWAGELHPKVLARLGLPPRSVAVELDLDVLIEAGRDVTRAHTLSSHPVATSDVALVVPADAGFGAVEESLRRGAGDLLESILLFDVYQGDQIGAGERSLAFRMTFRAADRTLTTQEVNAARDAAVARASSEHGAVQR